MLDGKKGLIVGVANERSIAAGCAMEMAGAGAKLALTYYNDKALPHVEPVAKAAGAEMLLKLDVTNEDELAAAFDDVKATWGAIDFLVHSIAYCSKEDLHAPVVECSRDGFAQAMDISCHSFIRMARAAVDLMPHGGALLTMTYHGAEKVVDHYNIMGPVKAALEASVRYLADDLGARRIRVNALSPGPIATRAASGIGHFDKLLDEASERAPGGRLVTIEEVGAAAAFLASDAARSITGGVHYIDNGYNVVA
ncbi:MAG: enoyl-ACP reductase FabI [Pseudomonadota bacterium]